MKTCEECGKTDETVRERPCGYHEEISGTIRMETICDVCEWQHLGDI